MSTCLLDYPAALCNNASLAGPRCTGGQLLRTIERLTPHRPPLGGNKAWIERPAGASRPGAPMATDPQNVVVDDLLSGECDRAGFIQRATMFGLVRAGDLGSAARSRRGAGRVRQGDARQGRRPHPRRPHADPEGHARALDVPGDGCPADGRHLGRVPQPQPPEPDAPARAGGQLEAERQRQPVDVQAAPGRQVRQRQADDRRRRRRDVHTGCSPTRPRRPARRSAACSRPQA